MTEWQVIQEHKNVSPNYVLHDNGRRGVIMLSREQGSDSDGCYPVVTCDTGEMLKWHYTELRWLYLVPKEQWKPDYAVQALIEVRKSIIDADPEVLVDTLWMQGNEFRGGTVVDRIDHALQHYGIEYE